MFRRHGIDYALDHPERLPAVAAVRLLRTAGMWQPGWQAENAEARQEEMTLAGLIAFYGLLPLAVAGAVVLRRRGEPLFILAAPVVLAVAITLVGYGEPRFRHGAELTLVVLAAVAIDAFGRRRAGQAAGARGAGSATVPRGAG